MPEVKVIKEKAEFDEIIARDTVSIFDFSATWCGPCKQISPIFEKLAANSQDGVEFYNVDVDESPEIAAEVGIRAMPTFMVFRKGEKKETLMGAMPAKLTELVKVAATF